MLYRLLPKPWGTFISIIFLFARQHICTICVEQTCAHKNTPCCFGRSWELVLFVLGHTEVHVVWKDATVLNVEGCHGVKCFPSSARLLSSWSIRVFAMYLPLVAVCNINTRCLVYLGADAWDQEVLALCYCLFLLYVWCSLVEKNMSDVR